MDFLTLARMKLKVIDLDEWGIDVTSLALNGGGVASCDIDHNAFWKSIPVSGNFRTKARFGDVMSYSTPSAVVAHDGAVGGFTCSAVTIYGGNVMAINMIFTCYFYPSDNTYSGTTVTVVVEQKPIPGV